MTQNPAHKWRKMRRSRELQGLASNPNRRHKMLNIMELCRTRRIVARNCEVKSGSVWESNPLRAFFKPPTSFEDWGRHQPCKHPREGQLVNVSDRTTGHKGGGPKPESENMCRTSTVGIEERQTDPTFAYRPITYPSGSTSSLRIRSSSSLGGMVVPTSSMAPMGNPVFS